MCCSQEVRWGGQSSRMLGMKRRRYKQLWSGKGDEVGGVEVMVKDELCKKVVEVRRVSDSVMTVVVVVFEEYMLRLICGYAPKSGRSLEEKQSFYDKLKCVWDMHFAGDLVICLGDFNGHIGRHIERFDDVLGGLAVGQRNLEGRMILVLSGKGIMCAKYMA